MAGDEGHEFKLHKKWVLGYGSFGSVFDAEFVDKKLKHIPLVCKEINIRKNMELTGESRNAVEMRIQREIELLKLLINKNNFVQYVDSKRVDKDTYLIFMNKIRGVTLHTLYFRRIGYKSTSWELKKIMLEILRQFAIALKKLESLKI